MSKSKVTVSKQQLAETGEELEVVGDLVAEDGAVEVVEGAGRIWMSRRRPCGSVWSKSPPVRAT